MPGAWWSKSDANFAALARVNDAEVAALLETGALRRVNVDEEAALLEMAALVLDTDDSFVTGSACRRIAPTSGVAQCGDLHRCDRTLLAVEQESLSRVCSGRRRPLAAVRST